MPTYRFTDPKTGKKLKFTGDSPPDEQQLNEAFGKLGTSPSVSAPEKGIEYEPGKESGNMLGGMVDSILGMPGAAFDQMKADKNPDIISATGKMLGKGMIDSGAKNAESFMGTDDALYDDGSGILPKDPLKALQAILSAVPLPGMGANINRGERAIQTDPNKPLIEDPNALEGVGLESLLALSPKIGAPVGKGIDAALAGTGRALGAPLRSNAIARGAALDSVPFEAAKRVPTPFMGNPVAWARSGFEEVKNLLKSPTAARAQTKLADILDPRGKIDPDARNLLGPMEEVVPPIQGPDNPLPIDQFDPSLRQGLKPNRNPPSAGPIEQPFVPNEAPLDLNLDYQPPPQSGVFPVKYRQVAKSPVSPEPFDITEASTRTKTPVPEINPGGNIPRAEPLAGGYDPRNRASILTPEEIAVQDALAHQREIEMLLMGDDWDPLSMGYKRGNPR